MAKVAGYVRTINVDLGDRVREGQVLAELEVPEMTNEVSKATAIVEETEAGIAASRDELQRAESAHQIAHLSYTRLQEVAKREAGPDPAAGTGRIAFARPHRRSATRLRQIQAARRAEQNRGRQGRRSAPAHHARLHHHHRAVRRHRHQTLCQCRLHDPGRNRLPVAGHAAGTALPGRYPAPESACTRIARVHHSRRRARRSAREIARPQLRRTGRALRRQGGHGHPNHDR